MARLHRLARVYVHLGGHSPHFPAAVGTAATPAEDNEHNSPAGLSASQVEEWVSRGMVVLPEEQMGLACGWHQRFLAKLLRQDDAKIGRSMYDFCDKLPIGELLTAPGVEAAVGSLLGPSWAVVPFANGSAGGNKRAPPAGAPPQGDQHWHKDDNMPLCVSAPSSP